MVEIFFAAMIDEQLEQARNAARPGMRQHLPWWLRRGLTRQWRCEFQAWLRHDLVNVVDVEKKRRRLAVSRLRQRNAKVRSNRCRVTSENDDTIGQQHRFLNVVRH